MKQSLLAFCWCAATISACVADTGVNHSPARQPVAQTHTREVDVEIPVTKRHQGGGQRALQFAVMGDRTGSFRPGVFEGAIEQLNYLQPDYVFSVGDLIEGYTDDLGEIEAQWDEFDRLADQLSIPFFYTVGNHDISNETMQRTWRARYGKTYYSVVIDDVLFLVLNTEDPAVEMPPAMLARIQSFESRFREDPETMQARVLEAMRNRPEAAKLPGEVAISDRQIEWARRTVKAYDEVRWTFVLMHKPAWAYDSNEFAEIEAALGDRPYTVIAGHEHYYDHERRKNRDYITMGTTGGVWLKDGPGRIDHMLWVTMTDEKPVIASMPLFDPSLPSTEN
ncbi:MAG: metallophosphoesterase [Pseudomonadota bacterium]